MRTMIVNVALLCSLHHTLIIVYVPTMWRNEREKRESKERYGGMRERREK